MNAFLVNIIFGFIAYLIVMYFVIKRYQSKKTDFDDDNGDDGGIDLSKLPDIDLPPGISLPHEKVKDFHYQE